MKQTIMNNANEAALNWPSMILVGLGVSFPLNQVLGGLFFALAAASIMAGTRKEPRKVWVMLVSATVFAMVVAVVWSYYNFEFPLQLAMGLVGLLSGWVSKFIIKFMDRVEYRADDIADNVIEKYTDTKNPK
jgi:hypothetical protein